jgi:hypothetical protein
MSTAAGATTIKVSRATRNRLRDTVPDGTLEQAINSSLNALEEQRFWFECDAYRAEFEALPVAQQAAIRGEEEQLDADLRAWATTGR